MQYARPGTVSVSSAPSSLSPPTFVPRYLAGVRALRPALLAAIATLAVVIGLCWPLGLDLGDAHLLTPFGDSHAWVFDWMGRHLPALPPTTCEAGYPELRAIRPIGWAPALVSLPLRALGGPLFAANLLQLLSLPLTAAATALLLARWTDAPPGVVAPLSAAVALSAPLLGHLATGELPNTQAWILPLGLFFADLALKRPTWSLALAGLGLLAAFTSPYYGLALPLILLGVGIARLKQPQSIPHGLLAAALLGLAMVPAWLYFQPDQAGGGQSLFQPALKAAATLRLPWPSPVATLDGLLLGPGRPQGSPFEPRHVATIGILWPLAGLLFRRAGRGRQAGLALAVGGILLALGPTLAVGEQLFSVGGRVFPLPVALLEALHYPTRIGGLYYRYSFLAILGFALIVAAGLPRRWMAWGLASLLLLDALRGTGLDWPRPVEAVSDAAWLEEIAGTDGAVLELPLQGPTDSQLGQGAMLRALFHRRPTTGIPRDRQGGADPARAALTAALAGPDPAEALRAAGYRWILLLDELDWYSKPDRAALEAALGPPTHTGALMAWDLGPTSPACQPR